LQQQLEVDQIAVFAIFKGLWLWLLDLLFISPLLVRYNIISIKAETTDP